MKKRQLLSLSDLYNFYVNQGTNVCFNSDDSNSTIVVHIKEPYTFSDNQDDELNLYTTLRLCHTLRNRNKSFISEDSMSNAISSAYGIPILAYIWHDDKTDEDVFASHEFYEDKDGDIVYEEIPVGFVDPNYTLTLSEADSDGKKYLEGVGKVWRTYSKAAEILEREQECYVSVELVIDELSFDAKDKTLVIDKFRFSGVTILGKNRYTGETVEPGMAGAEISISNFSKENNATFTEELLNELKKFNSNFETINNNSKEGGEEIVNKKLFEELLAKYEVSEDEIEFQYENLSDEELTKAFEEAFDEDETEQSDEETETEVETDSEDNSEDSVGTDDTDNSDESDETDAAEVVEETEKVDKLTDTEDYSLTLPDGTVKTFSLSLDEMQMALGALVNDTYSELDNDWYSVSVYPDESKVVMVSWWSGNAYRQNYKRKKDNFSLEGERVAVHSIWVSDDEEKVLNDAKANFESVSVKLKETETKLANYEAEDEKIAIFASEDYKNIANTEEFNELKKRENYFELSTDEIKGKLNEMLIEFAKNADTKPTTAHFAIPMATSGTTLGQYDSLIAKYNKKRNRY